MLLAGFTTATAQATPAASPLLLETGTRIRVKPNGESRLFPGGDRRVGVLRALTRDSLTIDWTGGGSATVPIASVSQLDASRGRQHFVVRGLLIGGVAGAGMGALIGAASYDSSPCEPIGCFFDYGRGFDTAVGAAIGGGAGLVVGGTVGAIGRREVWRRVRLGALASRVSVTPLPRSRGLVVRVTTGR